jgi:chromosome segregation ATPase
LLRELNFSQKALLRAVEDFKERITPVFAEAGAQAEEIAQLQEDLRRSNKENAKLKKLAASTQAKDRKMAELRAELEETRKISEEALVHAERASTENQRLQGELNRTNQGREEMTRENTRLKGLLEQHNKQVSDDIWTLHVASYLLFSQNRAQKSKIKGLQDEVARLKQTGHQEESLSLEGQAVISYEVCLCV